MGLFGFRKVLEEKEARLRPPVSASGSPSVVPAVADGDVIQLLVSGRPLLEGTYRPD